MDLDTPIDRLVQDVRYAISQTNGLFGFVFEPTSDGLTFKRGRPLVGTVGDEAILRQYFKPIGEISLSALKAGQNHFVKIDALDAPVVPRPEWCVSVVVQGLGALACAAVAYEVKNQNEAINRQRDLEAVIESRRQERAEVDAELQPLHPLLKKLRAVGCAVYTLRGSGESRQLNLFSSYLTLKTSPIHEKEAWESLLTLVRTCYHTKSNRIVPPQDKHLPDAAGRRWWHFILASGPVYDAGYAMSVVLWAKDESEVITAMNAIQDEFIRLRSKSPQ